MKKKDNFANNEAMKLIKGMETPKEKLSGQNPELPAEKQASKEKPPAGYKLNPLYIETKSRRLQLLVQPSLYDKIKKKAEETQTSINDYIHSVLQEALME